MDPAFRKSIVHSRTRVRSHSPYFGVLMSYMKIEEMPDHFPWQTACTDSRTLWICRKFWESLTKQQQDFLLVHEFLHPALGHCWRGGSRIPEIWNCACDYVVNLICRDAGFEPMAGSLIDPKYKGMTSDEVYAILMRDAIFVSDVLGMDVRPVGKSEAGASEVAAAAAAKWRSAVANAEAVQRMFGHSPGGRKIKIVVEDPRLDWRSHVWRELSYDHADFGNFDRRLVQDEIYVEDLEQDVSFVDSALCIDTSGSTELILGKFVSEAKSLASLYGHDIPLYFDDAELIGPVSLMDLDEPIGGGGTSFVPFFEEVERMGYRHVVYLTDLCGTFPEKKPNAKVLWVVPPGTTIEPPFGSVVKICD